MRARRKRAATGRPVRLRALWLALALAGTVAAPAQERPAAAETTIAALGDSLVQGYGLAQGEGLVPQLQDWLDARGHDVAVRNAGVSGDTSAGGRARLDWTLADAPDALIVLLGGNDALRGIDPAETRANLDAILARASEEGLPVLLVGIPAPGNFGPAYAEAFEAMFPDLADRHDAVLVPDMFAPLRKAAGGVEAARARYFQPDGIHPDAAGVARIVEDALGPATERLIARAGG